MQHCEVVDPSTAWLTGFKGYFLRTRGIATWALSTFGGATIAGLKQFPIEIVLLFVIAGFIGVVALVLVRQSTLRLITCSKLEHEFNHYLRDEVAGICSSGDSVASASERFRAFNETLAEKVAEYYREIKRDRKITCSIRIATEAVASEGGGKEYVTVGRSTGQDILRKEFSKPVPHDEGVPNKFITKKFVGVYIIGSIQAAIKAGDYLHTPNDDRKDTQACLIAPINGWENRQKVMVGMICIGHPQLSYFEAKDTVPLKAFADLLGLVYPIIIGRLSGKRRGVETGTMLAGPHIRQTDSESMET